MIEPLVSICCLTYNHEPYIRQCIEGFLMQKTSFKLEVLIHDDASTDKTADIIREYEKKYPDIIKPIYQAENQFSKGIGVSRVFQFPRARGKYIAMCEGDDYWTDPYKLQKQVDFLDSNSAFSGCAHQAQVIYENNPEKTHHFKDEVAEVLRMEDLLRERLFHTASLIFEADIIKKHPFPLKILSGDRALYLLISSFGDIRYFHKVMCVYRKNSNGLSSNVSAKQLKNDLNIVHWIKSINSKFPSKKYKSFIYKTIFTYPPNISWLEIFKYFSLYVFYSFSYFPKNIRPVISCTIKTLPGIIRKKLDKC